VVLGFLAEYVERNAATAPAIVAEIIHPDIIEHRKAMSPRAIPRKAAGDFNPLD
jgi:hypothetical protein